MNKQITTKELNKLISKNPTSRSLPETAKNILLFKSLELIERGVFEPIDLDILALYAENLNLILKIDKDLEKDGNIYRYTDRYGNERVSPHPLLKVRKDLLEEVRKVGKLFGFSPLDSQLIPPKVEGEAKEFLRSLGLP